VAELLIIKVTKQDLDKDFALIATNQHGSESYNIKISFDSTPLPEGKSFANNYVIIVIEFVCRN